MNYSTLKERIPEIFKNISEETRRIAYIINKLKEFASEKSPDPFFTTKRDIGGVGLGLSITSNIVFDHGGKLEFNPGKKRGVRTVMTLPVRKLL